jgi:hypothetical protein
MQVGELIWVDFLHHNPHRTRQHALLLAALSPLYGIVMAIMLKLLPLLTGAGLAVLGRAIFRNLPLWYLIAILPVCALADQAQGLWLLSNSGEELRSLTMRLLMFSAYQVPALLGCWWWARRQNSN